ncbi:C47 family peptidase, partial [Staphylococcus aureus]
RFKRRGNQSNDGLSGGYNVYGILNDSYKPKQNHAGDEIKFIQPNLPSSKIQITGLTPRGNDYFGQTQ